MNNTEQNGVTGTLRSVAKHSAVYTAADLMRKGIGFFMVPLYTHYLTPADYGLMEVLSLILDIVGMLIGIRILSAETRYYHLYEDYEEKREVYTTTLVFAGCVSVVAVGALFTCKSLLARLVLGSESYAPHIFIIILCFGIQNIYLVAENDLIVRKKSFFYSILSIGLMVCALSLNILLLSVFHLGVWAILWSMLITKTINLAVVPATLRGDRIRFNAAKLKRMIRFGLPLVPASLAMFAMNYSDRFILQKYGSLTDVGIYSLGYKFGMMISVLIGAPFQRAWSTHSFEIAKQADAASIYARVFTYFTSLLMMAALGISVFIEDAIGLIAPESYAGAAGVVPIIVLAYVFMGLANYVALGIMLSFRTQSMAYIQVPIAGLNIVLNIALIKLYGIMGASITALLTYGLMLVFTFWVSQRLYPIAYEYRRLAILFGTALVLYFVSRTVSGPWIWQALFHSATVLSLPFILRFLHFFTRDEIATARTYLQKISPWFPRLAA
jgi:O-antigen/teichoic acid export membrane protein